MLEMRQDSFLPTFLSVCQYVGLVGAGYFMFVVLDYFFFIKQQTYFLTRQHHKYVKCYVKNIVIPSNYIYYILNKFLVSDWSMTNAQIGYTVQVEVIQCNTEVAMETQGKRQI